MSILLIHYSFNVHHGKIERKMKKWKDGRRVFNEGKKKETACMAASRFFESYHRVNNNIILRVRK